MELNRIEIQFGLPSEVQTCFKLVLSKESGEKTNEVRLVFLCKEKMFARSLQVLLDPYFSSLSHKIEILENEVSVSVFLPEQLITDEVFLEIGCGIRIEGTKKIVLNDILESLKIFLQCKNLKEIAKLLGIDGVDLISSEVYLNVDPEDIPPEFLSIYSSEIGAFFKYFEVLEAVKPFLSESYVRIYGGIGSLAVNGEIKY